MWSSFIRVPIITITTIALLPIIFRYTAVPFIQDSEGEITKELSQLSRRYTESAGDIVSDSAQFVGDKCADGYRWSKKQVRRALSVEGVTISGNSIVREEDLFGSEPDIKGKWLWQVTPEEVEQRVIKSPWIKEVVAERDGFPVAIKVNVVEKTPIAVAEIDRSSWLVADSGELIQELKSVTDLDLIDRSLELPRLSGFDQLKNNHNFSFNVAFKYVADFLADVKAAGGVPFAVDRYELQDSGTIVVIPQDPKYPKVVFAVVDKEDSIKELLARVKLVLKDLDTRAETAQELDMRFKNQAIIR